LEDEEGSWNMASEIFELTPKTDGPTQGTIELPAPTAWPIILALGLTLVFAGLVTSESVSILGAIFVLAGCVGWFLDVLPHEKCESVPIVERVLPPETRHPRVARVEWKAEELQRARLPLEIYPISAGVKGGLAGSVAMAILAVLYGILSGHGIWYPINLLSAGFFPARMTTEQLAAFNWHALIIATILHLICSSLVGLLYGAALPMFPRRPVLFGGVIAPILWSALIYSMLEALDPVLKQRIDWVWFVASQIGFGIVAGIIVSKQERIRTWQYLPLAMRAGIEAPGAIDEKSRDNGER
jgi:hypothetical protein